MTAPHIVDPAGVLSEALLDASPDLMRSLLQTMINALLSADADAVVAFFQSLDLRAFRIVVMSSATARACSVSSRSAVAPIARASGALSSSGPTRSSKADASAYCP